MKYRVLTAVGLAGLLLAGCASAPKPEAATPEAAAPESTPSVASGDEVGLGETVTLTATVESIDLDTRTVVLKGKSGRLTTVNVGEEARNLDQVKVGDRVILTYREAVAVQLVKESDSGITERRQTVSGTRAPLGARPSATLRDRVEIVANVLSVNQKTRKVILQGPERGITVKVAPDIDISGVRPGDQVRVVYVEEFGVSVEPAAAAPKARRTGSSFNNKRSGKQ